MINVLDFPKYLLKFHIKATDNILNNQTVFLIIDTSGSGGSGKKLPSINITGNPDFKGIIWIIGSAELKGTTEIEGTIFVEGDGSNETKLSGNLTLQFSDQRIEEAVTLLGYSDIFPPGKPKIVEWKEI